MARGRIIIDLFTTLDGVAQAPGGKGEDPSGGFAFEGWQAQFPGDDMVQREVGGYIESMDALLLGRTTYDIFAGYWPHHQTGPEGFIGQKFTAVPKYVASRGTVDANWANTTQLGADVLAEIDELRDRHSAIHVVGSLRLVHTLLDGAVFDELRMWVHPLVLGQGRKVFRDGAAPTTLMLIEPPIVGSEGVVQLRYAPGGPVEPGSMMTEPDA